ncbi:MBL fold metallo-hydrolase RNA specificity domain-containing protein [Desulfurivibrio sp. D14AmB]|uniref:MBL fold metallo-hydrolase RNA specificity domain-containing protein n=1 Tax=Desulfurivibrio sp. D14AmB TaxID=3374370 RepID=UPI00376F423F
MKITFHGAAGTVTGSQHLIEVNGRRIMLDCGLFQGKRKESYELNRRGFCDGNTVDCLILSHAHIDHSGNIPCLVKSGFNGDILCTQATRDLCAVMLMDSAHIQEQDLLFVNKQRQRNQQQLFEPLYSKEDVVRAMAQFVGISPKRKREILPGIFLTFIEAGHMLGSANILLDIHEEESGRDLRLVYSGDIGRPGIPIIRDPAPITEGTDILIMESTYGNRTHPPYPDSERELERIVNETYRRGGCLLIPAFAVGRTQQLVYALHKLYLNRDIPKLPIYVDSPLATRVTDIFRLHPEAYDQEIREFILKGNNDNPFGFDTLRYTQSVAESKELNFLREPAIIISASGMMEAGRILHHLRNRISDPKNTILVTGWQAPNTLGRRIVEGHETVKIFGEEFPLRAKVEVLTGFSGHADRDGLLAWAGAMEQKPTHTFLVHGEEEASTALAAALKEKLQFKQIEIPAPHQEFQV